MKVKDLKRLLIKPVELTMEEWNDMDVLIPMGSEFDGYFNSPCNEESGVVDMGIEEDSDETKPSFMLVPCGFFDEPDEENWIDPELN